MTILNVHYNGEEHLRRKVNCDMHSGRNSGGQQVGATLVCLPFTSSKIMANGTSEQDEERVSECSTCGAVTPQKRYKCLSCPNMQLCRACYSQVHELHPSHVFLLVPDKRIITPPSEPMPEEMPDQPDELCMSSIGFSLYQNS